MKKSDKNLLLKIGILIGAVGIIYGIYLILNALNIL